MTNKITKMFSEDGELAKHIAGYTSRASQTEMAEKVHQAITEEQALLVEAGTGTGKTFAYLVPAFCSTQKVIISTGTKNLQEQLYLRDLPLIKKALRSNKSTALLKGRANYLCTYRLAQFSRQSHLVDANVLSDVNKVKKWSLSTKTGDTGELTEIAEDSMALPYVTSTVDNCLGRDCPDYEDCYLVQARKAAMEADLVVVNHHLFFADLALKDTGFGELIPEADVIVFDEAHQIPEIATEYFGEALSSRQTSDLCRDIEILQKTTLKDAAQLSKCAEKLRMAWADLRMMYPEQAQRGNWFAQMQRHEVQTQMSKISSAFDLLHDVVKVHLGRDKDLDNLFERFSQARQKLAVMMDAKQTGNSLWFETTPKHIVLHLTPLSIAEKFSGLMHEIAKSWIFTSATLSVDESFSHYKRQLGLETPEELLLESPFDYPSQALLCVPRYLPQTSGHDRKEKLLDLAVKLIDASKGRCFLLFTSHAMMRQLAEMLPEHIDNPILLQGKTSKRALLDAFLTEKDAVLLGTGAFWEGVDVKGEHLTCVMIDKLPFASPDDPLLQAKIDDCRKQGGNPFAQLQIPQAVITLKQGAGRLIRDEDDKGVLVICDDRLVNRDYGATFLRSLPNMRRTRNVNTALQFLENIRTTHE
ncbi:MAG: ATP-dependent DNA helicase [Aestuariibacter sp.]